MPKSEAEQVVGAPTPVTRFWVWLVGATLVVGVSAGVTLSRLNYIIESQIALQALINTLQARQNDIRTEVRESRADRLARQENADRVHVELDMRLDTVENRINQVRP